MCTCFYDMNFWGILPYIILKNTFVFSKLMASDIFDEDHALNYSSIKCFKNRKICRIWFDKLSSKSPWYFCRWWKRFCLTCNHHSFTRSCPFPSLSNYDWGPLSLYSCWWRNRGKSWNGCFTRIKTRSLVRENKTVNCSLTNLLQIINDIVT